MRTVIIAPAILLIALVFVFEVKLPGLVLLLAGLGGAFFYLRALAADDKFYILAVNLLYIPFSKIAPFDLAKGVNLTNILVFSLVARYLVFSDKGREAGDPRLRKAVYLILFFTGLSFFQALFRSYSPPVVELATYLVQLVIPWLFYLGLTACLSSLQDVRHLLLFSWVGYMLTICYGFNEFLDKRWNNSIDKSRIKGTLDQPNSYAGYIVYFLPLLGAFLFHPGLRLKLVLAASLFLALKVLLATFSRGAYLALGASALTVAFFKGRGFFFSVLVTGALAVLFFPGLVPDSVRTRLVGHTFAAQGAPAANLEEQLDSSSANRIVLWRAAGQMIAESPLLGKGLNSFPMIVEHYLEERVRERDTHNMFLKIAVYMGLPALGLYLYFIGRSFGIAWRLLRKSADPLRRNVALGTMGACVSVTVSCMFGSRMENIEILCYFMSLCAVVSFLSRHEEVEE